MADASGTPPSSGHDGGERHDAPSDQPTTDGVVFLVDDDEAVRDSVALSLRSAGIRVVTCRSISQLSRSYRPGQRSCLVVDLDLPDIEAEALPLLSLPTIVTSRRLRRRSLARTLAPLPAVLREKPFGIDDLLPLIRAALAATGEPT